MGLPAVLPKRRQSGLLLQNLAEETLVYDLKRHTAHCLSRAARAVWEQCDGRSSTKQILEALPKDRFAAFDETVVDLALQQLDKAGLLENRLAESTVRVRATRRELITKLGLTAALVPVVTSLMAPTAAAGASVCAGQTVDGCLGKKCLTGGTCRRIGGHCICVT